MTSLFRQGWKADEFFGNEFISRHMNTRSFYTLRADTNIGIQHSAPFTTPYDPQDGRAKDQFVVTHRVDHTPLHSTTSVIKTFDTWLEAYYFALDFARGQKTALATR